MDRANVLKWGSLLAFCLQNSGNPLINRAATTEASRAEAASTASILFCMEVLKFVLSFVLLVGEQGFDVISSCAIVYNDGIKDARDSLQLAVPALIYALQNALLQWSGANLPAAVFQVTYQGKILVTAVFSVLLLGKQIKRCQWLAIAFMGLGIASVELSGAKESKQSSMGNAAEQNVMSGLLMLLLACLCSGFASVFTERVFKQVGGDAKKSKSVWLQNMQLAFFSTFVAAMGFAVEMMVPGEGEVADIRGKTLSPFKGFTWKTWMLVVNNAIGGLLVALVIKYADNILRGFASAFATIICALIAVFMFGFSLSITFGVGSAVVIASTLLYGGVIRLPGDWWTKECEICAFGKAAPQLPAPEQKKETVAAAPSDSELASMVEPPAQTVGQPSHQSEQNGQP